MNIRKSFWWPIILFALVVTCAISAQAQDASVGWVSSASYAFGKSVTFELVGETAVSIDSVTLIVNSPSFTTPQSDPIETWESSGNQVKITHSISSTQLKLRPFTTADYWWEVKFENGTEIELPVESFVYEDDRLAWQTLVDGAWQLHWTGNDDLGTIGLQIAQDSQRRLESMLRMDDELPINLYIYPSSADLRAAFRLNGLDWVGGVTSPAMPVLMVTAVNPRTAANDLQRSIPYALTRFRLDHQFDGAHEMLPLWLQEGLAAGMVPENREGLETAVSNQSTIPFSQLCHDFPTSDAQANLAIAQSVDFVQYFQTQYGNHTIQDLVDAYANGAACDAGVTQVVGKSLNALNQDWLRTVRSYPLAVQFIIDNSIWFLLILFMAFITGFLIWKI